LKKKLLCPALCFILFLAAVFVIVGRATIAVRAAATSHLIQEYKSLRAGAQRIVDGDGMMTSFVREWYAADRKFQSEARAPSTRDPRGDWAEAETFLYMGVSDYMGHPNDACRSIARANLRVADYFFRAAAYSTDDSNPPQVGDC
jgi:hypothetical protein